jgi:hypothetical protein
LITSVDSLRDLKDVSKWNAPGVLVREARVLGSAVLVSTLALIEAAAEGIFSGFDEIWMLREPPRSPPPAGAWLVGPRDANTDDMQDAIAWMTQEPCELGLGDGVGLSYVARTEEAGRALELAFGIDRHW